MSEMLTLLDGWLKMEIISGVILASLMAIKSNVPLSGGITSS